MLAYCSSKGVYSEFITRPDFPTITRYLQKQPKSWEGYYSLDEILTRIADGAMHAWIFIREGEELGIMLWEVHTYGKDRQSIKIIFLSCKHFIAITRFNDTLEHYARQLGVSFIEAIAHPTIAEYALRKFDYEAPGVYIVKTVRPVNKKGYADA